MIPIGHFNALGARQAPVLVTSSDEANAANSTTFSPTVPSHSVGDLLIVHISVSGAPNPVISINKSFTIINQANPVSASGTGMAWKVADGDDSFTVTSSNSGRCATRIEVFRNFDISSPPEMTAIAATATPANITPSWGAGKQTYFGYLLTVDASSNVGTSYSGNWPDENTRFINSDTGTSNFDLAHQAYRSNTDVTSLSGIVTISGVTFQWSYRYAIMGGF